MTPRSVVIASLVGVAVAVALAAAARVFLDHVPVMA